jgi:hypothetical protein
VRGIAEISIGDLVDPAGAVRDRRTGVDQGVQQRLARRGVDDRDLDDVAAQVGVGPLRYEDDSAASRGCLGGVGAQSGPNGGFARTSPHGRPSTSYRQVVSK